MRQICFLVFIGLLIGCGNGKSGGPGLVGFEVSKIEGSDSEWAIKRDHQGNGVLEQGPMLNGLPNGAWTSYAMDKQTPKTVVSLIAGKKSGPYIEFNQKSEMKLYAEYFADKLHGKRIEFGTIGRFLKEANYKHGVLHGEYSEWSNSGKLTKTMNYIDGQLHGPFAFYDAEGKKVAEYRYENGNKVAGGVIQTETTE